MQSRTVITGTGSYIPSEVVTNRDFTIHNFYAEDNQRIETPPQEIVDKLEQITGIAERRYAKTLFRILWEQAASSILTNKKDTLFC